MKKILVLTAFLSFSISTHAGPRVIGNGGDVYALQFITFAQYLLKHLQNSNIKGLDIDALGNAINTSSVESTEEYLKLNGMDKDAINYPSEKRIIFNRIRWSSFITNERLALVLHEYLGLLGTQDANYQYSKFLLKDLTTINHIRPGSDSTWILCQDDTLIINAFEHRNGPDGRSIDFSLLFGSWVFQGTLNNETAGPVTLQSVRRNGTFTGDISVLFQETTEHRLIIVGVLNFSGSLVQINSTLPCSQKYGRQLGR